MIPAKDIYRVQRDILGGLIAESAPGSIVKWDEDRASTFLRFHIETSPKGTVLIESSGDQNISDIAAKSIDELRKLLTVLGGGKL